MAPVRHAQVRRENQLQPIHAIVGSIGELIPSRLWKLREMLEIDAQRFVEMTNFLRSISHMGRAFPDRVNLGGFGDAVMATALRERAEQLAEMRLPTTRGAVLQLADAIERFGPYNDF